MIDEPRRDEPYAGAQDGAQVVEISSGPDGDDVRVNGASPHELASALLVTGAVVHVVADDPRAYRPGSLSEREVEIVRLVASGVSNEEVARSVSVTVNTVKSHIRSAYRKMGVTARAQAVLWAVEHGLAG